MLTTRFDKEPITAAQRAKLAYVYVRQSSPGQVKHHQESTDLQYRLVERAVALGWPRDRITVIDEDLGKSGASSIDRLGFQQLMAEIGLGKAGLVLSLDASRLARNNRDWYQLLELCSVFGVLLTDAERLYDPRTYHDRLLLGLSGMMSEAELHQIQMRLQQGGRHKAERGELRLALPAGLVRSRTGEIVLNPDEEVRARLQLVFDKFRELKGAKAVMRYLQQAGLTLPVRPLWGPAPQDVVWQPATSARVVQVLKNPAYAGAYVYGRRRFDPTRRRPGVPRSGTVKVPLEQWPVCLVEAHPGYIRWEEFLANQKQLAENVQHYADHHAGVPRNGLALLQGVVLCGRCSRRMQLRYSGPHGNYPVYVCAADQAAAGGPRCQEVRAPAVDAAVERLLLEALAPDQVALAVTALEQIEEESRQLERQWGLKRERARYEAERARRQYDTVEPENRLVARHLERGWEDKLRQQEQVEHEYERWRREQPLALTETDQQQLLAVAEDLPRVWQAETTTPADRKQILRLVVQEVVLDQKRAPGRVWLKIHWQTGATTEHWVRRRVQDYRRYADREPLEQRVRELNAAHKMDAEIAACLNEEGLISATGRLFQGKNVHVLRQRWQIPTVKINGTYQENPLRWPDGSYSVRGTAAALEISPVTVFVWLRRGRLEGEQLAKGMPWQIRLSEKRIAELKQQLRRISRSNKEVL
ncbi:MAG: recombinase family protein [Acidobacteriaceae bacterium]|nr:recombinase family protein [Acidobacteriaceae bacterium]